MTMLTRTDLHDGWTMTHTGGQAPPEVAGVTVPTAIPGTSHTALLDAGLIPDPYLADHEKQLEWMWRCSWRFATTVDVAPPAPGERVDVVFDGIDTVAEVSLGGTPLGSTRNMHRSYRWDIRDHLAGGPSELTVDIASALDYANQIQDQVGFRPSPYPHPYHAIRKMACSFGWDWGPDLQTAGIWKSVRIERWRHARIVSVRPLVDVRGTTGLVSLYIEVQRDTDQDLTVSADIAGQHVSSALPAGETTAHLVVEVPDVDLWWPVGYGEPHLYDLEVTLTHGDDAIDSARRRIGFRTVTVDMTNEGDGAGFTFLINGRPVFIRGANWIPDDHLLTRITRERLERRVDQALGAHMNLLRIWGGGIFETEDFYEVCNERGMLVWQDFLFACAAYAENSPLLEEIEAEARENVARLCAHPSLVLYNGSNENIWGWCDWGWPEQVGGDKTWGLRYYQEILPALVAELDPTRPYTPSSPFSPYHSHEDVHPNDPAWGTVHEWDVWNRVDYRHYRDYVPRFCAEFGFQGPATWATLERSLPPEGFAQDSPLWLLHQKAEYGQLKLNGGYAAHLPDAPDFETWHWLTQLNQAHAIRYGIEHYRSWWPRCAGAIVWQLNDCWPVTSWAAIDGDERPKPLYYALQHAYRPRLLTFQPRSRGGGEDPEGPPHLVAVNDTDQPWEETVTIRRLTSAGTDVASGSVHIVAGPRESVTVVADDALLAESGGSTDVLVADADGARALWYFAEYKDMVWEPQPFEASAHAVPGGYQVEVTASALVCDLTVLADKVDPNAVVDTALVTLIPGETHVFSVASAASFDPRRLLDPRVLVSVHTLAHPPASRG